WGPPEAVSLERIGQGVDADTPLFRRLDQVARDGEQLVVRRRVGILIGLGTVRHGPLDRRARRDRLAPRPPATAATAAPRARIGRRLLARDLDRHAGEGAVR